MGTRAGSNDGTLATDAYQPDRFRALGKLPHVPQWLDRQQKHHWSEEEHQSELKKLLTAHADERAKGLFRIASQQTRELFDLLEAETSKGYWESMYVEEAQQRLPGFCSWLYFGIQEADKLRGCLSPEEANNQKMVFLPNVVWMAGLDGYMSLCQALAGMFRDQGRYPELQGFAEDYDGGFCQFKLSSLDGKFLCATAKDETGRIKV